MNLDNLIYNRSLNKLKINIFLLILLNLFKVKEYFINSLVKKI